MDRGTLITCILSVALLLPAPLLASGDWETLFYVVFGILAAIPLLGLLAGLVHYLYLRRRHPEGVPVESLMLGWLVIAVIVGGLLVLLYNF